MWVFCDHFDLKNLNSHQEISQKNSAKLLIVPLTCKAGAKYRTMMATKRGFLSMFHEAWHTFNFSAHHTIDCQTVYLPYAVI